MENTMIRELNNEELCMATGGKLSKSRKYAIAIQIAAAKCGYGTRELLLKSRKKEEQDYINLIWDEVPADPFVHFNSPNIPSREEALREIYG